MVVFPAPFGPMIPVSPRSKSIWVSACWRKLTRRMLLSLTAPSPVLGRAARVRPGAALRRRGHGAGRGLLDAEHLRLGEVAQPELHERAAVDVAREDARLELGAHGVHERRPAA